MEPNLEGHNKNNLKIDWYSFYIVRHPEAKLITILKYLSDHVSSVLGILGVSIRIDHGQPQIEKVVKTVSTGPPTPKSIINEVCHRHVIAFLCDRSDDVSESFGTLLSPSNNAHNFPCLDRTRN